MKKCVSGRTLAPGRGCDSRHFPFARSAHPPEVVIHDNRKFRSVLSIVINNKSPASICRAFSKHETGFETESARKLNKIKEENKLSSRCLQLSLATLNKGTQAIV